MKILLSVRHGALHPPCPNISAALLVCQIEAEIHLAPRLLLELFAMTVDDDNEHIPAKRHRLRGIVTYEVPATEFDRIEEKATSIGTDLQFATFWWPVGIAFTITITTTKIENPWLFAGYVAVTVVAYAQAVLFTIRWRQNRSGLHALMERLRSDQVGPVGEKGSEMQPSELQNLPAEKGGTSEDTQ